MPAPRSGTILRAFALVWLGLLAGFAIGVEWIRGRPEVPRPSGGSDLAGAGAIFPYPLYRRWVADYATDRPRTAEESARGRCGVVQFPTVAGAVAVAYDLPSLSGPLHLDASTLAAIFRGRITCGDAPALRRLAALTPGTCRRPVPT